MMGGGGGGGGRILTATMQALVMQGLEQLREN